MLNYLLPLILIIVSNTIYQICSKSIPSDMNAFASFTITYAVASLVSLLLYLIVSHKNIHLIAEYQKTNWAPFLLGVVIVGLEVGFIYCYKAGWPVSTLAIVSSAILAIALIGVGYLLYKEAITWNKILGIIICLVGLGFINFK